MSRGSVWGVYVPAGAEEFPGPQALRRRLWRCSCGELSFLPLPCGRCGGEDQEPAFRHALRRAWIQRIKRWALGALLALAGGYVGYLLWPPLALAAAGVVLAAPVYDLLHRTDEEDICFWLFHRGDRGKLPAADIPSLEAITDAYDTDVRRLELMLGADPSPAGAERVFYLAQSLTEVFHNRRISALLAHCLAVLPLSEGICVDLDQICAWLEPEDLAGDCLRKLGECARLTCLPPGEQTARFVARFCALRVREYAAENGMSAQNIPELVRRGTLSLGQVLEKQERAWLSALWNAASGGMTPRQPEQGQCRDPAKDWFWCVWSDPGVFRELDRTLRSPLGAFMEREWGSNGA